MHSLCITSGKGGVGKTTLAVNLGIAMARGGKRVLLLDGDMGMANLNVQMGINPEFTIHDVVRGRKNLSQIVIPTEYGLDLIAGGSGIAELAELGEHERQNVLHGLEELHGYDILIIDTGAGIGDNVIRFILAAERTVIVTTPEPTSLTDAYGIVKTVLARRETRGKTLKLLVNCVVSGAQARDVAARLNSVTSRFLHEGLDCIGSIPCDPLIQKSIMAQKPHLILNPSAASARHIREAATRLVDDRGTGIKNSLGGFLRALFGAG